MAASRRALFLLPFGAVMILAFGFTTLGPTLAWAIPRLAWWEASLLAVAPFLAVVAAGLPLGRAGDRSGHGRVLLLGLVLLPAGLALPLAGGSFPVLLAAFTVMGLSFIAISAAANPLVAGLFPERLGSSLTLLHVGWSAGAFAGPVTAGLLLAGGDPRSLFALAAGLGSLFLAAAAPLSRTLPGPPAAGPRREFRLTTPLLLLVLLGFFYSG
ncbi:MAG: MFS transporter [Halobacteria archaeon]